MQLVHEQQIRTRVMKFTVPSSADSLCKVEVLTLNVNFLLSDNRFCCSSIAAEGTLRHGFRFVKVAKTRESHAWITQTTYCR